MGIMPYLGFTTHVEKYNYFSQLDAAAPQIYGLYWSRPQVMARQDEFDPDRDYIYADRLRRRRPGDTTLGLSPHVDAGSYERWLDPLRRDIPNAGSTCRSELARESGAVREQARSYKVSRLTWIPAEHFVAGKSPPDFAVEDYEVDYEGRATVDDLTELGRKQIVI